MKTVEFLRKHYVVEGTVGAPDDAIFLDTLPADKLVELRNLLVSNLDLGRSIKMFQSKAKGIRLMKAMLLKWDEFEVAVCPHPSGINRWWNYKNNVAMAQWFWVELATEAARCNARKS